MKIRNILSTIILILILSLTVGFSAFVSEMSISSLVADVRIEKDVRITGFSINGGSMSGGLGELNWDANSVMLGNSISVKGDNINLEVTITNIGSAEVGIYDIVVPEGIDFEITNYNMESKICDASGKCNLGISKTICLKVSNSSYSDVEKDVKIDFEFREIHSITYEGFTNNSYPTEIIHGGNLSLDFTGDIPENVVIYSDGVKMDSLEYDYYNNSLTVNNVSGDLVIKNAKNLFNIIKLKTNGVDSSINFASASSSNNGDGVNTLSGTEGYNKPVYYYRGAVTDNYVLFANNCWKIVRTTQTGGVKLVYNGVPKNNKSCENSDSNVIIGYSLFNEKSDSHTYVGYMYGKEYSISSIDLSNQSETYIYGNDVVWDGSSYSLNGISNNTLNSSNWSSDKSQMALKYHYTCFNSSGVCKNIYYITYFGDSSFAYFLTLSDGKNIENVKDEMFANNYDSLIKITVDNWYKNNLSSYTQYLEDTVWCNDRTIVNGTSLYGKDDNGMNRYLYFGSQINNVDSMRPNVTCSNIRDSFTVSSSIGNGKLIYPVGLLTGDEYTMAGFGIRGSGESYLKSNMVWTMSPYFFNYNSGFVFSSGGSGMGYTNMEKSLGVRPSVSLKPGTYVSGGDGSITSPYIVE